MYVSGTLYQPYQTYFPNPDNAICNSNFSSLVSSPSHAQVIMYTVNLAMHIQKNGGTTCSWVGRLLMSA
jgi:hypothetical protein